MDWSADLLQWPAAVLTVTGAWFVASTNERRRKIGFWLYMASNVAWVGWGLPAQAYAVVLLQVCLAAMNVRGVVKAKAEEARKRQARPGEAASG